MPSTLCVQRDDIYRAILKIFSQFRVHKIDSAYYYKLSGSIRFHPTVDNMTDAIFQDYSKGSLKDKSKLYRINDYFYFSHFIKPGTIDLSDYDFYVIAQDKAKHLWVNYCVEKAENCEYMIGDI